MPNIIKFEKLINEIYKRNKRVEADKAWETSITRRVIIALSIYIILVIFLTIIKIPYPLLNSLIPAIAYFLSTLTLPFIKKWWIKNFYNK